VSRSLTNASVPATIPQVLGVGLDGLAWAERDSNGTTIWRSVQWGSDKGAQVASEVWGKTIDQRAWLSASDVVVCMGATLVNSWVQPVPAQTQSLAELHAVASARAKLLFGSLSNDSWLISAEWDYKHPFVCTALAQVWSGLLSAVDQTHKQVRIVSTLSLVLSEFAASLPKTGWLAILVEDRLHLMHRQDGYATSLRSLRLPDRGTSEDLETVVIQEWTREKIRTQHVVGKLHRFSVPSIAELVPNVLTLQNESPIRGATLAAQQAHHLFLKVMHDAR